MSSGTIFGKPQGKWMVGSIAPQGAETALSGKWIGEYSMINYPALSVKVPERTGLGGSILGTAVILGVLYYLLRK